jgi:hypothetical protein
VSTVARLNNKVKTYTHNNGTSWVDVCVYLCLCKLLILWNYFVMAMKIYAKSFQQ